MKNYIISIFTVLGITAFISLPSKAMDSNGITQIPLGWVKSEDGLSISKEFNFKGYKQSVAFFTLVALKAEENRHHPKTEIDYSKVTISLTTHSDATNNKPHLGEQDIKLAQDIDTIYSNELWKSVLGKSLKVKIGEMINQ